MTEIITPDLQSPLSDQSIGKICENANNLLREVGCWNYSSEQVLGMEAINGAGKSTTMLALAGVLRIAWPERKVLVMKGSGAAYVDPLTLLCDAQLAYPDGIENLDLESLYLPIAESQWEWQQNKNFENAADMMAKIWVSMNAVLFQGNNLTLLLDRTPVSGVISAFQRVESAEALNQAVKSAVQKVGRLPVPRHVFLEISLEEAVKRRESKGEKVPEAEKQQLLVEQRCFGKFFADHMPPEMVRKVNAEQTPEDVLKDVVNVYAGMLGEGLTMGMKDLEEALDRVEEVKSRATGIISDFEQARR